MALKVSSSSIVEVLDQLWCGHWQIPGFQREFIWSQTQAFDLLRSIFKKRPIGLITLWNQPQSNPHCESEPVKLKELFYRSDTPDPAVLQLVLDGRQRLTTLAIAFGGLRAPDDRHLFSGRWFVDINKYPQKEDFIVYKKKRELEAEGLGAKSVCLQKSLVPLDQYKDLSFFQSNINNPDIYEEGQFPSAIDREARSNSLRDMYETFMKFQIPYAELPDAFSLAEVCDIFDVLNTTGTKVSTFDLIHNLCFASSRGEFDLRTLFEGYQGYPSFGLLCEVNRPEYFCQAVTACFLTSEDPAGKDSKTVQTIKGGDLVNTPYPFYEKFSQHIEKVDTYTSDLFESVLSGQFRAREIPYPVSVLHYVALRWKAEGLSPSGRFTTEQLGKVIRAYFWRNALTQRYDQGFLSLFATDLRDLDALLSKNANIRSAKQWTLQTNSGLNELFKGNFVSASEERIQEMLTSEVRGAVRLALYLFVNSRARIDIVDGKELNRFSTAKMGVISPVRRLRGVLQLGLGDTLRSGESAGGLCV